MIISRLLVVVVAIGLAGCFGGNVEDVRARVEAIKAKPRGRIEPPPEFTPMPTFTYAAHQLRSPFAPPEAYEQVKVSVGRKVVPDFSRAQEYLERYNIEVLRFTGHIQRPGGPLYALIQDGEGATQRVKVGNYLGKNYGRIVEITPTQVSIIEIVPDGRDGWVERPRSLVAAE